MTDLMRIIYECICERRYKEFLPREYYWQYSRLAEKQEEALLAVYSEPQKEMLDEFQTTLNLMHAEELEAMFQATWDVVRELR